MSEVEKKLRAYLKDLDERRQAVRNKLLFCCDHNFEMEAKWLRERHQILSDEYVEIHNKVLGEYY